eukprot:TRINITY_DN8477_c0_g1_i1.p1 TRINITY_DN8477_c0_g1~~TRINITY_DN8477_c0_g1_i1.p1  ORF type:complete len:497 (+),score=98.95 TRINITY_DN8477_c0_g1_i1:183-1673(+)
MRKTPDRRPTRLQEPQEHVRDLPNPFGKPPQKPRAVVPQNDLFIAPKPIQNENLVSGSSRSRQTPNAKKRKREPEPEIKPDPGAAPQQDQSTSNPQPPAKRRALAEKTNDIVPAATPPRGTGAAGVRIKQEPTTAADVYREKQGVELIKPDFGRDIKDELVEVTDGPWGPQVPLFTPSPEIKEEKKPILTGGLFLGNVEVAYNQIWQDDVEIKAVVNAAVELRDMKYDPKKSYMLHLVDEDRTRLDSDINKVKVTEALDFIDAQRQAGNSVLVHCKMGQSRSVSIVLLYMVERCGMTLAECMRLLEEHGVKMTLKIGMQQSLMAADEQKHGKSTYNFFDTSMRRVKKPLILSSPWKENDAENTTSRTAPSTPKRTPSKSGRKPLGPKKSGAVAKSPLSAGKAKRPAGKKASATVKASQKSGSSALQSQSQGGSPKTRQQSLEELLNKLSQQAPLFEETAGAVSSQEGAFPAPVAPPNADEESDVDILNTTHPPPSL